MTDDIGKKRAKELGLKVWYKLYFSKRNEIIGVNLYKAEDIHKLLAGASEVFSSWHENARGNTTITDTWKTTYHDNKSARYKALLIGSKPIKKETAEDLLREVLSVLPNDLHERARKVLDK